MFTCKYCGVQYQTFHSSCPACGAPILLKEEGSPEKALVDKIHHVCERYVSKEFKDQECIPEERMARLRKSFRVFPHGKEIFLYCDTTPLGTGKRGFLICEDGLYWQNAWTTSTNHNSLNWDMFKKRTISLMNFDLDLGKGDAVGLAGLGSRDLRELVLRLLKQIQDVLNEPSQEQSKS